jgi:4-hydroxy-3-polyprenylbenzoate decarboxylase
VAIRKDHAGQARRVAQAVWGLRPLMFTKLLVIVDEGIDVRDAGQVWSAVAVHADLRRDVFSWEGPADPWDPAAAGGPLGCRVAIDATAKLPGERAAACPGAARTSDEIRRRVSERWAQYGLGPAISDPLSGVG